MLREAEEQLLRSYLKEKKMMSDNNITYFMNEFEKLTEQEKPCWDCLDEPVNIDSEKPLYFKEK